MPTIQNENDLELLEEGLAASYSSSTPNAVAGRTPFTFEASSTQTHFPPATGLSSTHSTAINNHAVSGQSPTETTAVATTPSAAAAGPELIGAYDEPPLPIDMTESILDAAEGSEDLKSGATTKKSGRVEHINDGAGPHPPVAMLEELLDHYEKTAPSINQGLAAINAVSPPTPFNFGKFEDDDDAVIDRKQKAVAPNEYSTIHPTRAEIEDEVVLNINRGNTNSGEDEESPPANIHDVGANNSNALDTTDNSVDEEEDMDNIGPTSNAINRPDLERDLTFHVPTAWAVHSNGDNESAEEEEFEIVIATPALPWHKQPWARRLLALVFLVVVALAITLGIVFSYNDEPVSNPAATVVVSSDAPSISIAPSSRPSPYPTIASSTFPSAGPTTAPSSSLVPSLLPTACVYQISSNMQKINLQGDLQLVSAREFSKGSIVAVDGRNMLVVAQEGDQYSGVLLFVVFYAWENDGWQIANAPIPVDDLGGTYSVALSGTMAFVGFSCANGSRGTVLVYEQNQFGEWGKVEDPFIHDATASDCHWGFGQDVEIDGDLACVVDDYQTHIFHRESNKWVQFDMIDRGRKCSISGDTIAIMRSDPEIWYNFLQLYKYNQDLGGVVPIQDPIPTGLYNARINLSHDYLVYWDDYQINQENAFFYRREETNHTFALHQQLGLFSSGPYYNSLALDGDILVVSGLSNTHIFSCQNGNWEESIALDLPYDHYQLSGRTLLAAKGNEVFAFNIEDCTQAMPTQTPSLSMAPTPYPTASASMSPSSSMAPSSSFPPTGMWYCIEIAVVYDRFPEETSWELLRVVDDDGGGNELVKSLQAADGHTSHAESICLQEGEYEFTIYDSYYGLCCFNGEGHYNVTSSNGALIAEGGNFRQSETTTFSLPVDDRRRQGWGVDWR